MWKRTMMHLTTRGAISSQPRGNPLRYGETVKKITGTRQIKINRTVSRQITDDEKLVISTINPAFSAVVMNSGKYIFAELVKLLAQNATSFTKRYVPTEHSRISK
jgi:hypothetical protein